MGEVVGEQRRVASSGVVGPSPPQAVSVARLGALRWAELAVFALAGGWVTSTPEPTARVALAAVSRHAARRAGVLGDRLPPEGPLEASLVTTPASSALVGVVADLEALVATGDRLAALGELVLPGIADGLESFVGTLAPVADASSLRYLPPLADGLRADAATLVGCAVALGLPGGSPALAELAGRVAAAGGW